jgi:MFS family permease
MDGTTPKVDKQISEPDRMPSLFINRNFRLLWSGQTISVIGDLLFDTTLVLWIASQIAQYQTWAPLAVSGVLAAAAIPTLLVPTFAGVFVDRWDKRLTMMRMDVIRSVLILSLLLITGIISLPFVLPIIWRLGIIYTVVFLAACCAQFFNPSQTALIGDLVPEPLRARASGLSQVTSAFAVIIGPPLATVLYFTVGVRWALTADALSFVISLVTLLAIRAPRAARSVMPGERGHFWRELGTGLRFFFANRVLVTILVALVIAMAGAGAINTLDYFFVTHNLHASPTVYGYVGAVFGAGILIGALASSTMVEKLGAGLSLGVALTGLGAMLVAYSRMTSLLPALILLFIGGVLQALLNVAIGPLLLHVTPRELIGRIVSIIQPAATVSSLLSIAVSGYLASTLLVDFHTRLLGITLGPIDTIFTVAGLLALISGLYSLTSLGRVRLATREEQKGKGDQTVADGSTVPVTLSTGD